MVNAKLSLSFPKRENESRTRYFPYINRLVKCPLNERKCTVQPRFPCAEKREVNSKFFLVLTDCERRVSLANSEMRKRIVNLAFSQYINRLVKSPENRRFFAVDASSLLCGIHRLSTLRLWKRQA